MTSVVYDTVASIGEVVFFAMAVASLLVLVYSG